VVKFLLLFLLQQPQRGPDDLARGAVTAGGDPLRDGAL
jgi:hypothetical protein